ncbi:MAG: pantoate--beta-alanine ligase, partial [Candidatus Ratteibacteria bacterium]
MKSKKIKSLKELQKIVENLKIQKKKIVFTNGCFDILHAGHLHLLEKAKKKGDILIVGLNSDESVRKLKGNNRPIIP